MLPDRIFIINENGLEGSEISVNLPTLTRSPASPKTTVIPAVVALPAAAAAG